MRHLGSESAVRSDESLIAVARGGDRGAFGVLWQRHARSGIRVARQFTSSIDADDLVAEAFTLIYRQVLSGGGPDGSFRPYLYTTIRNLARRWGRTSRDISTDDLDEFEDPDTEGDPVVAALDRTFTVRAFRSLPERWQSVLWYTEVEGLDPHEVAPLLGLSANSVAALSYRAREGLRKAWLQAHVADTAGADDCRWTIAHLGDYSRSELSVKAADRVAAHLAGCEHCSIIAEEVDDVAARIALVLLPLILGGVAGGAMLTGAAVPSGAAAALPAMPAVFGTAGAATAGAATAAAPALLSGLAVVVALTGGLAGSGILPLPPGTVPPASAVTTVLQPIASPTPEADAPETPAPTDLAPAQPTPAQAALVNAVPVVPLPAIRLPSVAPVSQVTDRVLPVVDAVAPVVQSITDPVSTLIRDVPVIGPPVSTVTDAVGPTVDSVTNVVDATVDTVADAVDTTLDAVTSTLPLRGLLN
jgi:RNA polymerase sigma factor (sigma-70 family)